MINRRNLFVAASAMTAAASLPNESAQAAEADSKNPVRYALNMQLESTRQRLAASLLEEGRSK